MIKRSTLLVLGDRQTVWKRRPVAADPVSLSTRRHDLKSRLPTHLKTLSLISPGKLDQPSKQSCVGRGSCAIAYSDARSLRMFPSAISSVCLWTSSLAWKIEDGSRLDGVRRACCPIVPRTRWSAVPRGLVWAISNQKTLSNACKRDQGSDVQSSVFVDEE